VDNADDCQLGSGPSAFIFQRWIARATWRL
jgi:hypothetical protein